MDHIGAEIEIIRTALNVIAVIVIMNVNQSWFANDHIGRTILTIVGFVKKVVNLYLFKCAL